MARRRMRFVGVQTQSSSIMTLFPVWSRILGLDAELVGLDIPLHAPPETYRAALREMKSDPACVGALVTTHKIRFLDATRDLFDDLDQFADQVGEVSSISLRRGQVLGAAKDPLTAGLALEEVLAPDHFCGGGEVLCLGAGGAGTAIGWYLAQRPDRPSTMTFVDTEVARLEHLREVLLARGADHGVRTGTPSDGEATSRLAALPPGSLVINASGLGKDRPGTPLPDGAVLPAGAVIWELNYRGSLEFLHAAGSQQESRDLTVVDGWRYFIHGWTQVIADVFEIPMPQETVRRLAEAALILR